VSDLDAVSFDGYGFITRFWAIRQNLSAAPPYPELRKLTRDKYALLLYRLNSAHKGSTLQYSRMKIVLCRKATLVAQIFKSRMIINLVSTDVCIILQVSIFYDNIKNKVETSNLKSFGMNIAPYLLKDKIVSIFFM